MGLRIKSKLETKDKDNDIMEAKEEEKTVKDP